MVQLFHFFLMIYLSLLESIFEIKLADDPEFTKVEYFTPSHLDHFFQTQILF